MVYLIHLHSKFHHSNHYIGWAKSRRTFSRRIAHHRNGSGAKFLRAVNLAGINWEVVRIWNGETATQDFERRLKNCKKSARFCPVCNPATWETNMRLQQL